MSKLSSAAHTFGLEQQRDKDEKESMPKPLNFDKYGSKGIGRVHS